MSAFLDTLQVFIEQKLKEYDPTIDLTPGSPAQSSIIQPILNKLGTDPFDIDIKTFLIQKGKEAYPNIDFVAYDDLFINPLILFLEPFKQEINRIKLNQSIINRDLMTDEEVDAILSNWYANRNTGSKATVPARVYFPSPQPNSITTNNRITTSDNLLFHPITDYTFISTDLLFNKEGAQYYVDITLRAEEVGSKYNIEIESLSNSDITGSTGIKNFVKGTGGFDSDTNAQFIDKTETSLNERSLNTDRGIRSRLTLPKAITTIGAGDKAMQRDILEGTGQGHTYLTSECAVAGNLIILGSIIFKELGKYTDIKIEVNDEVRYQKNYSADPLRTVYRSKVKRVVWQSGDKYIFEIEDNFPVSTGSIIILKPGFISISKTPQNQITNITVPENTVHLGGFTDVFVRPSQDENQEVVIKNMQDSSSFVATLKGRLFTNSNKFQADDIPNLNKVIKVNDMVIIDTGTQIGSYKVLENSPDIRLDTVFSTAETNLKCKIIRDININLNTPKNIKLPYQSQLSDLSTTINSNLFRFKSDVTTYNVVIGDIIEILDGPDRGTYKITSFDTILGGKGVYVDRAPKNSKINLPYKIYSIQEGISLPLININNIELLDTKLQTVNINVPYKYPVKIKNECDFSNPEYITIDAKTVSILPDLISIWPPTSTPSTPSSTNDTRYSQLLEQYDGVIKTVSCNALNPIQNVEINLPPFLWNGKKDKLIVYANEKDADFIIDPSGNAKTSPAVNSKEHYCIRLIDGPNSGYYLIKDVRILNLWNKSSAGHQKIAILQLDGEVKVDPIRTFSDLIILAGSLGSAVTPITSNEYFKIFDYATEPDSINGFLESLLIPKLQNAISFFGLTLTTNEIRDLININLKSSYSIGEAPKGIIKTYFMNPTSGEFYSDSYTPTLFETDNKYVKPLPSNNQVYPLSSSLQKVEDWARNGSTKHPIDTSYYIVDGESFVLQGVKSGDIFQYYPAINDVPSRGIMNSSYACITQAGSDVVQLILPNTRYNNSSLNPGQILTIDSGIDEGSYTIVEVLESSFPTFKIRINKKLTTTTFGYPMAWSIVSPRTITALGGTSAIYMHKEQENYLTTNSWISIISANSTSILQNGDDTAYLGTFKVLLAATSDGINYTVGLDRTDPFPADATIQIIIHNEPTTPPVSTSDGGTELTTQYARFRLYDSTIVEKSISIDWTKNPTLTTSKDQIILSSPIATVNYSHKSPFRILRKNYLGFNSTELLINKEFNLYYVSIPSIAIGLGDGFSFKENTDFDLLGNYYLEGYYLQPINKNYSYSVNEEVDIIFSPLFLPKGMTPNLNNKINLLSKNMKINYKTSTELVDIQNIFNSPADRILCENALVRHFLPAFIILDLVYSGGSSTDIIATDIINLINNIGSVTKELRADSIIKSLLYRGAKTITQPINLVALVHDLNRKIKMINSNNRLGVDNPIFDGFNSQVFWILEKNFTGKERLDGGGLMLEKI